MGYRNKGSRSGFTILELMFALALVSAVATVAIPAYFHRGDVTLENAAVLLARDIRAAQNRSAYLGEPSRMEFFADRHGYRVTDWRGRLVHNPRTDLEFIRNYAADGVFEGVEVAEVRVGEQGLLRFDDHGRALNGGRITLTFGADMRILEVEKGTGRITIEGSTSNYRDLGY